jgi:hypothetical protein
LFGNIIVVPVPIPSAQDFNNDDDKGESREWVGGCAVVFLKMDAGGEGSGPTFGYNLSGVLADLMSISTDGENFLLQLWLRWLINCYSRRGLGGIEYQGLEQGLSYECEWPGEAVLVVGEMVVDGC